MKMKYLSSAILLTTLSFPLSATDFTGGARPACDPAAQSCLPEPEKTQCDVTACFSSTEQQKQYEMKHGCELPTSSPCGQFDTNTQCCGRNPRTNKAAIIDKVFSTPGVLMPGFDSFTWANLKMACPNRRQNDAPTDDVWKACQLDKPHDPDDPDDHYDIIEIRENGTRRPFCIDGCSIPPLNLRFLHLYGFFLYSDRNNPTGYSKESSFLPACIDHDVCYQTCDKDQAKCDDEFLANMTGACNLIPRDDLSIQWFPRPKIVNTKNHCIGAASVIHLGLQIGGNTAFNKRRQQYCQCC